MNLPDNIQKFVDINHFWFYLKIVDASSSLCVQYPLCTLLVFDSRQHALPVAWIITRSFAKSDVSKWMKALLDRAHSVEPGWKVSGFLIDDAATEIDPIM